MAKFFIFVKENGVTHHVGTAVTQKGADAIAKAFASKGEVTVQKVQ